MDSPTNADTMEVVGGIMEALRELGCDVCWREIISRWPSGHKLVARESGPEHTPYVLFVSGANVWICFDDGSTLAKYDLAEPDSLEKIAAFIKQKTTPKRLAAELPMGTQVALAVKQHEYDEIVALWEAQRTTGNSSGTSGSATT